MEEKAVVCSVGPPCSYIVWGASAWCCNYEGICIYQRPQKPVVNMGLKKDDSLEVLMEGINTDV